MLPIVKAWLAGDPDAMRGILRRTPRKHPHRAAYQALCVSEEAIFKHRTLDQAVLQIQGAVESPPADVDLYLALLTRWAVLMLWTGRPADFRRIRNRLTELAAHEGRSLWQGTALALEASGMDAVDTARAAELYLQSLAHLPPRCAMAWRVKGQLVTSLAHLGRIDEAARHVEELERDPDADAHLATRVRYYRAWIEQARPEAALQALGPPSEDWKIPGAPFVVHLRFLLLLRADRLEEASKLLDRVEGTPGFMRPVLVEDLKAWRAVAAGDFDEARRRVRGAIAQASSFSPSTFRQLLEVLVVAEL